MHKVFNGYYLNHVMIDTLTCSVANLWFPCITGICDIMERVVNGLLDNLRSAIH